MRHLISLFAGVLGFATGLVGIWAIGVLFPHTVEIFNHRIAVLAAVLPALTSHALVELGWDRVERNRRYAHAARRGMLA